jgi:molecular chaperone DnaJ
VSPRDPHEVLGVPCGAGSDDIRRAYKKLAARFHPDNQKDGSVEKFREVTEAFDVLKNAAEFEQPNDAEPEFIDKDLMATVGLTLEEMAFGCHKTIVIKIDFVKCAACFGKGFAPGSPMMPCITCLGTGKSPGVWGFNNSARPCSTCRGSGVIPAQICKKCSGKGRTLGEAEVKLNIPAGTDVGQELHFFGNIGPKFKGRLFVKIVGIPHLRFERCGNDLVVSHKVNVIEAMRGCTVVVQGLDDAEMDVTVPAGTQPGDCMLIRGKGIRNMRTGRIGDMCVAIQVEIPKKMSPRAARLVEELADEFIRK